MRQRIEGIFDQWAAWILSATIVAGYFLAPSTLALHSELGNTSSLLGYMLLHTSPIHLAVNIITLLFISIFWNLNIRQTKMLASFAIGIIAGSITFFVFTMLTGAQNMLVGCSSGVFAVASTIIFSYKHPSKAAIAIVCTLLAVGFFSGNISGSFAHVGGAVGGFIYGYYLSHKHNSLNPSVLKAKVSGYASLSNEERKQLLNN